MAGTRQNERAWHLEERVERSSVRLFTGPSTFQGDSCLPRGISAAKDSNSPGNGRSTGRWVSTGSSFLTMMSSQISTDFRPPQFPPTRHRSPESSRTRGWLRNLSRRDCDSPIRQDFASSRVRQVLMTLRFEARTAGWAGQFLPRSLSRRDESVALSLAPSLFTSPEYSGLAARLRYCFGSLAISYNSIPFSAFSPY